MEAVATMTIHSGLRNKYACENGPSFLISVGEPLGDHLDNFIKMNVNEDLIEEDEDVDEVQVEKKDVEREKSRRASGSSLKTPSNNDQRVRRTKRPNRERAYSMSEGGKFGGQASSNEHSRSRKSYRKSRCGFGKSLPKKGAGGKGTWGRLGCELELPWVDPHDPNFESDAELESTTLESLVPEMSEEDIVKSVQPMILEYFENNDCGEVLVSLQEILPNLGPRRWMIVTVLIELAMDHKPSHREMASCLISELYQKVISQRDLGKAFDYLMNQLPDLILDTPDACDVLGNFMARAIADDCIPPKFLSSYKGHVEIEEAKNALQRASTLFSMKHGLVRLDNVWGVGGGVRPVKSLVKKIIMLLKEYLNCGDIGEANRCLMELEVPHFHHELVYEAVVMVIEAMHEKTAEAMAKLLESLVKSFTISYDQMKNGFERVYDMMPDLIIDVPAAYTILERFVLRCRGMGVIDEELVRTMPVRNRKRFVSEGDGGRLRVDFEW